MDNYVEFQLLSEVSGLYSFPNPQSETGNPSQGWESEGQIRNSALCPMLYALCSVPLLLAPGYLN